MKNGFEMIFGDISPEELKAIETKAIELHKISERLQERNLKTLKENATTRQDS